MVLAGIVGIKSVLWMLMPWCCNMCRGISSHNADHTLSHLPRVSSNWWVNSWLTCTVLLTEFLYYHNVLQNSASIETMHGFVIYEAPVGRFKNTYELLNLRALKILMYKNHLFQCMGKIFCEEFQRYPLKFHTKYLTHTLKEMIFVRQQNFKSS